MPRADAIVVGAGPNGLAAANLLADAGLDVVLLEANGEPGGAVRSGELLEPGFTHDLFSSFYPLGYVSPVWRGLGLERFGLRWVRAEAVVAHPRRDGTCATLWTDLERTAASMESFAPGDGEAWKEFAALWDRIGGSIVDALLSPFPPLRPTARLVRSAGSAAELLRLARLGVVPVGRFGQERFAGDGGRRMLAGNALHADLTPESPGGAIFALVLCGLGQQVGFPVPEGGAGQLTRALVARLEAAGGRLVLEREVTRIDVRDGRARGVETADGDAWEAPLVLADVGAPALYRDLVGFEHLPDSLAEAIGDFQYDSATFKVDWALDEPIPWTHPDARAAGTLHVAEGVEDLARHAGQLEQRLVPDVPFLVMGQYATVDPSRQPEGRDTAWAYTHLPQEIAGDAGPEGITGRWDEAETAVMTARVERRIEELAPGFGERIRGRHVFTPKTFEETDANLVNGALNGGTAQLHQQLVLRPTPGLSRAETPIAGLFLASASAHPGGAVHGACGANAARAALSRVAPRMARALQRHLA